jgi:WD40 repeat protein
MSLTQESCVPEGKTFWDAALLTPTKLAVQETSGLICIWDLCLNEFVDTISIYGLPACPDNEMVVLPNSRIMTNSIFSQVSIWSADTKECKSISLPCKYVKGLTVLPENRVVCHAGTCGDIYVIDTLADKYTGTLIGHCGNIAKMLPLAGGRLASLDCNGKVFVWDLATGTRIGIGHCGLPSLLWSMVLVQESLVCSGNGNVVVFDLATFEGDEVAPVRTFHVHPVSIETMVALPGGRLATHCGEGERIHIWCLATGEELAVLSEEPTESTICMVCLPNGKLVTNTERGTLKVWELDTYTCTDEQVSAKSKGDSTLWNLLHLQGNRLLSHSSDDIVKVWEVE